LFDSIKLSDVLALKLEQYQQIITISTNTTIQDALSIFSQKAIHIVPIIHESNGQCLGTLTTLDIAGFIAEVAPKQEIFQEKAKNLFQCTVSDVMKFYKSESFIPMDAAYPLKLGVSALCNIAHAVPIVKNQQIKDILTQADINNFIASNPELYLGDAANKSLSFLGLVKGSDAIHKVTNEARVVDTLHTFYTHKINAAAVVDTTGSMTQDFSASDLTTLNIDNISRIYEPLSKFLSLGKRELIYCKQETDLGNVVKLLAENKVHRVWILGDSKQPIGLISLSDIMKQLNAVIKK